VYHTFSSTTHFSSLGLTGYLLVESGAMELSLALYLLTAHFLASLTVILAAKATLLRIKN